jgi:hypothetical protein
MAQQFNGEYGFSVGNASAVIGIADANANLNANLITFAAGNLGDNGPQVTTVSGNPYAVSSDTYYWPSSLGNGGVLYVDSSGFMYLNTPITTGSYNASSINYTTVYDTIPQMYGAVFNQANLYNYAAYSSSFDGSLPINTTYYFVIVAYDSYGNPVSTSEFTTAATTSTFRAIGIEWNGNPALTNYQLWFGTTSGGQNKYFPITLSGPFYGNYSFKTTTGATSGTIPSKVNKSASIQFSTVIPTYANTLQPAWTTNGIGVVISNATYTDNTTTANGIVSTAYMNYFGTPTYASNSANVTVTNLYSTYFANPVAGANTTATNTYAIGAASLNVTGNATVGNLIGVLANGNSSISIPAANGNININAGGGTTELVITTTGVNVNGTLNSSGNANVGNIGASQVIATANISAPQLISSVATGTAPLVVTSTTQVPNLNVATSGTAGTVTTNAQPNITSVGTLTTLSVTGNITGANLIGNHFGNGAAISSITGANVTGQVGNALVAGTVYTAAQPNITSVGTLTTLSVTGNTTISGTFNVSSSNLSAPAWTTSGIAIKQSPTTFTDTTSTGTVATVYVNLFDTQTVAATNAVTVTNLYGTYFKNPARGANVSGSAAYALGADSLNISVNASIAGLVTAGGLSISGNSNVTSSTGSSTVQIAYGATVSGNTKTVNIGTGGASGSTTTITIGSNTAPGTVTVNGSIQPLTANITTASTITPTAGTTNQYNVTALASAATIAAPSGTPVDGQRLTIRIKDNGTAQALTWTTTSGAYRAVGVTLPATTVISKVLYVDCIYNSQDTFWDAVKVAQQ